MEELSKTLYEKWRKSFGRDGPNYSMIKQAVGKDRELLETELIIGFKSSLCTWDALALGILKSIKAKELLIKVLESAESSSKPYFSRALWDITGEQKYLKPIALAMINQNNSSFERMSLIGLLCNIHDPDAFTALESALFDPDYLVRRHAAVIYSRNSAKQTADQTIRNNLLDYDKLKISEFAKKLKRKI